MVVSVVAKVLRAVMLLLLLKVILVGGDDSDGDHISLLELP